MGSVAGLDRRLELRFPEIPEAGGTEPITGWRVWRIEGRRKAPELRAVTETRSWPPGRRMEAVCRFGSHRAPVDECRCGIYGLAEPAPPPYGLPAAGFVAVGQVALWGEVVAHRNGYRAQFAYPQRLGFFCMRCLEERRAVPASVVVRSSPYGPLCERHRGFLGEPVGPILSALLDRYRVDRLPAEVLERGLVTAGDTDWDCWLSGGRP